MLNMFFDNKCTHTMVNELFGVFVEVGSSGILCCLATTPVMINKDTIKITNILF